MDKKTLVGIIMGSDSDYPVMQETVKVLDELEIGYEVKVLSAHKTPQETMEYAASAEKRGIEVIITAAGGAFHLGGVVAACTHLPVIAVPLAVEPFKGWDALFSALQMPGGIPVAVMSVGKWGARNAAIFAAKILALKYPDCKEKVAEYREKVRAEVREKSKNLAL